MALPRITATSNVEWHESSFGGYYTVNGKKVEQGDLNRLFDKDSNAYQRYLDRLEEAKGRSTGDAEIRQAAADAQVGQAGVTPERAMNDQDENQAFAATFGVTGITGEQSLIEQGLAGQGVDVAAPEVQRFIQDLPDGFIEESPDLYALAVQQLLAAHPSAPQAAYDAALQEAGFGGDFMGPANTLTDGGVRSGRGHYRPEVVDQTGGFETSGDYLRYKGGVLVDLTSQQVLFQPGSVVPGSPRWILEKVPGWSSEKIHSERQRLHQLGYLSEDAAKLDKVDESFLSALRAYHMSRYLNGGKAIPIDLAGMGSRDEQAKLVDVREEMGAQIRNSVRSVYRNVYGTDPSDGEVSAFSSTIFETAMQLQRKFRSKYGDPNVSAAVSEATERQVERIENSPQATFLRESEEENTRLRDSLERAVVSVRGLA